MPASEVSFRLLDLNLLRVFDALLSEGSVSGAATALRITPSAVSHALARLRDLFDDPLFVRSPRGMLATPRACEIGPKVRRGLQQLEIALAPVEFSAAESDRVFTVACSAYVCAVLLPGVMAAMRRSAPHAGLSVVPWGPGVIEQFEAGQIDVLVGDFIRVPERFPSQPLFTDQPVWLMGRDYVVAQPMSAAQRAAKLPPLAAFRDERGASLEQTVIEHGFERRIAFDERSGIVANPFGEGEATAALAAIPYASVAPLVVKHADIAALVPRRLALLFARSFALEVLEPAAEASGRAMQVSAVWQDNYSSQAALAWFRGVLAETAGRSSGGAEADRPTLLIGTA